jgi:hypothetical protein
MDILTNPARLLGLMGCLDDLGIINTPNTINITGFFPICPTVVGILDPCLFFFFLFFRFFFFVSTGLLASELSLNEEDKNLRSNIMILFEAELQFMN